jgi:hypothetical protein
MAAAINAPESATSDGWKRKNCPPDPSAILKYDGSGRPLQGQPGRDPGCWSCAAPGKTAMAATENANTVTAVGPGHMPVRR